MTDRELLEAAAKAAGYEITFEAGYLTYFRVDVPRRPIWNPLNDDGDALRLAVKLGIDVQQFDKTGMVEAWKHPHQAQGEDYGADPAAATRRAIVRAAAAMAG